ncbi:MAG: hypothetical protein QXT97_02580 [Candidatus Diapherotrites archaeon]
MTREQLKNFLLNLEKIAKEEAIAFDLVNNRFEVPNDGSIVPFASSSQAVDALRRIGRQVSSNSNRILRVKLDGILGSFNWQSNNNMIDDVLQALPLSELLQKAATDLVVKGITALAIGTTDTGKIVLYPLNSFVCRIPNPQDPTESLGILQAWEEKIGSWTIKLFSGRNISTWYNKKNLVGMLDVPDERLESTIDEIVFFTISNQDEEGLHFGELTSMLPDFKALIAAKARLFRMSEIAIPRLKIKGTLNDSSALSHVPDNALLMTEDSDASYIEAPSINDAMQLVEKLQSEIIQNSAVPAGLFNSNVSGVALEFMNAEFNANVSKYAKILSELFTNALKGFLAVNGINDETFSFFVTPKVVKTGISQSVKQFIELYEKGIITLRVLLRKIQDELDLSDAEIDAIAQENPGRTLTAQEIERLIQ